MSDYIAAIEAAYDLASTNEEWLRGVGETAWPWLERGLGIILMGYDLSNPDSPSFAPPILLGCPEFYAKHVAKAQGTYTREDLERSIGSGPLVGTVYDGCNGDTSDPLYIAFHSAAPPGVRDYLTLNARAPDRAGVIVGAPLRHLTRLDAAEKRAMTRVGIHFTAGYRLRRALSGTSLREDDERVEAVLTPRGKVEHAAEPAKSVQARTALRERAIAIDRARSKVRHEPDEALELWKGLVSGRWSLVDRFDADGRRYLVALRNDPNVRDPRALTPRERQMAGLAGMGYPNKLIAYALGLSQSSVSVTLRSALRKLGLRHRAELAGLSSRDVSRPA